MIIYMESTLAYLFSNDQQRFEEIVRKGVPKTGQSGIKYLIIYEQENRITEQL